MRNSLCFLLCFVIPLKSVAAESAQKISQKQLLDSLKIYDFDEIITAGFSNEFLDGQAITLLTKSGKATESYQATISVNTDEKRLDFITSEKCSVEEKKVFNSVVSVNRQNIQFRWFCVKLDNGESRTAYGATTEAGNSFLIEQFRKEEPVLVKFRSMIIPFDAANFNKAWGDAGGPAL